MENPILLPKELTEDKVDEFIKRRNQLQTNNLWQDHASKDLDNTLDIFLYYKEILNTRQAIKLSGRIVKLHLFGKFFFAVMQVEAYTIELKFERDRLPIEYENIKRLMRHGDIIEVSGKPTVSKRGNPLLIVEAVKIISICSFPDTFDDRKDLDGKGQTRFVFLQMIGDPYKVFAHQLQGKILHLIREYLEKEEFLEQITPALTKSFYGGRSHPYVTFSRSEERNMYLRMTSEIGLKLLICGGMRRVYEIGPSFRNESKGQLHLSPFTMLEAYAAFTSFEEIVKMCEDLLIHLFEFSNKQISCFAAQNHQLPTKPFDKITAREVILQFLGCDIDTETGITSLSSICDKDSPKTKSDSLQLIYWALKNLIYPKLDGSFFIYELPAGLSPLIASNQNDSSKLLRGYFVVNGIQLAEVFSSNQDPIEEVERLKEQFSELSSENNVVRDYSSYIYSIFMGIPPISVMDISLERLFMFIQGEQDIRRLRMSL